jgi:hypothetical protein
MQRYVVLHEGGLDDTKTKKNGVTKYLLFIMLHAIFTTNSLTKLHNSADPQVGGGR